MLRTFFFFAYAVVACIIFAPIAFIGWLTYDKSETGPVGGVVQWVAKVALPPAEKLMGAELYNLIFLVRFFYSFLLLLLFLHLFFVSFDKQINLLFVF